MSKHNSDTTHICSNFHDTIEFIGKRWTGIIIYRLMSGPKRFNEIAESIPGISDRLLTERLNELVLEGIVIKTLGDASTKKIEYELTPSGLALKEVITAIGKWTKQRTTL